MDDEPRKWYWESGEGRLDLEGVEWFTCDPYPTWFRWENGELFTRYRKPWLDGLNDYGE